MNTKISKKIIIVVILITMLVGELGIFAAPQKARAEIINPFAVPAFETGGNLNAVEKLDYDPTAKWGNIMEAAQAAAANTALSYFSRQLGTRLQSTLGIKSYQQYQAALVDTKNLLEAYSDQFGDNTVAVNSTGKRAANIQELAADAEGDLRGFTPAQTRDQAVRDARSAKTAAAKRGDLQKRMVRASSLFASSVACGGVNDKAIRNLAEYMTGAAMGFTSKDVDPTKGLDYYQKLAKMGAPEALPQFWVEGFKDNARQKESQARAASVLELLGPGLKSPQTTGADGKTKVNKSLSLVSVGQQNANTSLFNIGTGKKYAYDTSSMFNFVKDVTRQEVTSWGLVWANKGLHKIGLDNGPVHMIALGLTGALASSMANHFVTKLYNEIGEMIFQGEFIAESDGCRKPPQKKKFTDTDREFKPTPGSGFANKATTTAADFNPGMIMFQATPEEITSGESVLLAWDATSFGSGITVTLSGGGVSGTVDAQGSAQDAPTVTTTYTLTVTGPGGINQSASVTVTVNVAGAVTLLLEANPQPIESDRKAMVKWDGGFQNDASDEVLIDPLSEDGLPYTGEMCYVPNAEQIAGKRVDFTLFVENDGDIQTKKSSVDIVPPAPRVFEFDAKDTELFPGGFTTMTWKIEGFPDSVIKFNDSGSIAEVGPSATITVGPGDYTLSVEEANGCGVIVKQAIRISIVEVCGDGLDNNGNGEIDEAACATP